MPILKQPALPSLGTLLAPLGCAASRHFARYSSKTGDAQTSHFALARRSGLQCGRAKAIRLSPPAFSAGTNTPRASARRQHSRRLARKWRASGQTPVIIDGGANVGDAALHFARLYPEAVIIAVEPNPETFERSARIVRASRRFARCLALCGRTTKASRCSRILKAHGPIAFMTAASRRPSACRICWPAY